jgi:hypothetical protein
MVLSATGTKARIQVKEMAIRPKARRFVHFVPRSASSSADPSVGWLFCATLSDGSKFAIDVCNAQYTVNTSEDPVCGVFPWEQYMERLSVTHGDLVGHQYLGYCLDNRYTAGMTGTARDVQAGIFTLKDKECVAGIFATGTYTLTSAVLHLKNGGLTMSNLVGLPTSGYEERLNIFKARHQERLGHARNSVDRGDAQWMLLERFRAGAWIGPS